jgi:putative sterol carrier protein
MIPMDQELKEKLKAKIDDGSFSIDDLQDYIKLLVDVCNETDDIKEEVEGWDRKLQFVIRGSTNAWLKVADSKAEAGEGDIDTPDITLEMDARVAAGVFSGEIDATSAYMAGDLKVVGPLPDAVKFRTITEMVREALD